MKKITTIAVTALTMCSALIAPITSNISNDSNPSASIIQMIDSYAASGRLYYQYSSNWNSNLKNSGCGIFALANGIYALNGKKMDVNSVATWSKNKGYWLPGRGGTVRDTFYGNITSKYGSQYGFKVNSKQYGSIGDKKLIDHLKSGGIAIAHVGRTGVNGHFIAITGYNGNYHVIDSVNRCAGSTGDAWRTKEYLSSSSNNCNTKVDWYCLISKTTSSAKPSTSTSSQTVSKPACFKKYTGNSGSIVTALNAIGVNSSYSYRKQIAAVNNISNYSGTASQNTTMLNKLKAGTLIKPASTSQTASKPTYFKKYTGGSGSIVTALNAIGVNSSYSYRKQIAAANNISNYSGTAAQNTTMLKKLKAGTLIKP